MEELEVVMEIGVGCPLSFMVENFFIFDGNVISRRKRPGCLSRKEGDYSGNNNSSHARKHGNNQPSNRKNPQVIARTKIIKRTRKYNI
jgi:hypothetical protein